MEVICLRPRRNLRDRYNVVPTIHHIYRHRPVLSGSIRDGGDKVLAAWQQGHVGDMLIGVEHPLLEKLGLLPPYLVERVSAREETFRFETGQVFERVSGGRRERWKRKRGPQYQTLPDHGVVREVIIQLAHLEQSVICKGWYTRTQCALTLRSRRISTTSR